MQIVYGLVGQGVGLVAFERGRVGVVQFVDRAVEVLVEVFETEPVLEAGAKTFGGAVARTTLETPGGVFCDGGGYLVTHDAAVPFAEIRGAITGFAQFGRGAGRGGFENVEEARDGAGVRVAPAEDGAARRGADRTIGVGARKAGALSGEAVHPGGLHIRVAHMPHGLAPVFVGKDIDDMWFIQRICS